jgi:hypothetical protein
MCLCSDLGLEGGVIKIEILITILILMSITSISNTII